MVVTLVKLNLITLTKIGLQIPYACIGTLLHPLSLTHVTLSEKTGFADGRWRTKDDHAMTVDLLCAG